MKKSKIHFKRRIESIDFKSKKDFIFVDEESNIFRNELKVELKTKISILSPIIKIVSKEYFILINRDDSNDNNCLIINNKGVVKKSFFIDSPQEVITTKNYLITSYSDAMLGVESEFGDAQIVVFDYNGNIVFKNNSVNNKTKIEFLENKSFVKKDDNTILFMPYGTNNSQIDMSIIEFNLIDFSFKHLFYLSDFFNKANYFYFTAFTRNNNCWYFFDQDIENWSSNKKGNHIIYELKSEGEITEKYRDKEIALKPITGLINEGFGFLSYSDLESTNVQINYISLKQNA